MTKPACSTEYRWYIYIYTYTHTHTYTCINQHFVSSKKKKRKYSSALLPEHTTTDSVTGVTACVISGFRHYVDEICALVGCYVAPSGN